MDPHPYTLAELVAMHDERQVSEYDRTSTIAMMLHNSNCKKGDEVSVNDLNPYEQDEFDNSLDETYTGGWATRDEYEDSLRRNFDWFVKYVCKPPDPENKS